MANEEKIAHLGFIQGVINRMGNNSFLIKGWVITLIAAIFALSAENANTKFIYIAFFPLIIFWWLDAFFLHQERLYRVLYQKVANNTEPSDQFSMNAYKYKDDDEASCLGEAFFSKTLLMFYLPILTMVIFSIWKLTNP